MPRITADFFKQRRCQNDGRYDQVIADGELVILDQGENSQDIFNKRTGHVVRTTPKQFYISLIDGPVIRRSKKCVSIRLRGFGKSLQPEDFPENYPPPDDYVPPIAYEDRFKYKHGTEYTVHTNSVDSQDSSSSHYKRTYGIAVGADVPAIINMIQPLALPRVSEWRKPPSPEINFDNEEDGIAYYKGTQVFVQERESDMLKIYIVETSSEEWVHIQDLDGGTATTSLISRPSVDMEPGQIGRDSTPNFIPHEDQEEYGIDALDCNTIKSNVIPQPSVITDSSTSGVIINSSASGYACIPVPLPHAKQAAFARRAQPSLYDDLLSFRRESLSPQRKSNAQSKTAQAGASKKQIKVHFRSKRTHRMSKKVSVQSKKATVTSKTAKVKFTPTQRGSLKRE